MMAVLAGGRTLALNPGGQSSVRVQLAKEDARISLETSRTIFT